MLIYHRMDKTIADFGNNVYRERDEIIQKLANNNTQLDLLCDVVNNINMHNSTYPFRVCVDCYRNQVITTIPNNGYLICKGCISIRDKIKNK